MPEYLYKWMVLFFLLGFISCLKVDSDNEIQIKKNNIELAFPLFHSSMNIEELAESVDAESSILIDGEDRIALLYRGAVVEGNSTQVFPPAVGLIDIKIPDTVFTYSMPINYWEEIHIMTMGQTNLEFKFSHHLTEKVNIHVEIEEMTRNDLPFKIELVMENGSIISEKYSVNDYMVLPTNNSLTIRYVARNQDGQSLKLDDAAFNFDVFRIKYIEGIFSPRSIDVQGDVISVGILENWKSGGLTFSAPELYLRVENSFGIQAFSQNSTIEIETTDGQVLPLESQILESEISFNFPALDQRGEVKVTEIIFDKDNSNLENLFSGKASKIKYNIDASINNQNSGEPGFISEDGYFRIEAVARLPLSLTIDNLILEETADFDGSALEDVESAQINWSFKNEFPIDVRTQVYLYQNNTLWDSVFVSPPFIAGAEIISQNSTIASEQKLTTNYENDQINRIREADSVKIISWFDTKNKDGSIVLYNKYRLHIDAGILAKVK